MTARRFRARIAAIREEAPWPTSLKSLVRSGGLAGGTLLVECVTPGIGHILAAAGCEFAFLDMEHSGFEAETVKAGLRFLEAGGVPAFVRVTSRDTHDISRIADIGAEGIIVSLVDNGTVAKAAVDALKYPPLGRRGVGLGLSHDNFRTPPTPAAALQAANERTVLALMIETAEGVENAEAIASTPGVDLIWVGHFDLSTSLGVAGAVRPSDLPRGHRAHRRRGAEGGDRPRPPGDLGAGGRAGLARRLPHPRLVRRCLADPGRAGGGARRASRDGGEAAPSNG